MSGSWAPAASKVYTAARKLDRYQTERVHGKLTRAEDGESELDTTSVRTRLICGADVVGVASPCLLVPAVVVDEVTPEERIGRFVRLNERRRYLARG